MYSEVLHLTICYSNNNNKKTSSGRELISQEAKPLRHPQLKKKKKLIKQVIIVVKSCLVSVAYTCCSKLVDSKSLHLSIHTTPERYKNEQK